MAAAKVAGFLAKANVPQQRWVARRPVPRHWVMSVIARHPGGIKPDAMFEALMKGADKPGFEDGLRAIIDYDFRERIPQIACPTLVVWGEKDMIIPVRDADAFVSMIEGARKIIMKDTGHVPMFERPRTFNQILNDFLFHEVEDGELEGELEDAPSATSGSVARERDEAR